MPKILSPEVTASTVEYEVGYGKPPKSGQFQKGNKKGKGRSRGSRNMASRVRDAFEETVPVKQNGKVRKRAKFDIALQQLANKAAGGDLKAIAQTLTLQERYEVPDDTAEIPQSETGHDLETIRQYLLLHGRL